MVFPKSSLTRSLQNIYPLPQIRNIYHIQKRIEVGGISTGKAIEILKLPVRTNKSGCQTYTNEDKESLEMASDEIECGRGLPLD